MKLADHVIVEGPNGGGKTTLIKELEARGFPSMHTGGPKHSDVEVLRMISSVLRSKPCIVDRIPIISQTAYDWALERPVYVPEEQLFQLFHGFPHRPVVVYCRPGTERLMNHVVPGRQTHPPEHIEGINRNRRRLIGTYDRLISELSACGFIRPYFYDWESGSTVDGLLAALKKSGDVCVD